MDPWSAIVFLALVLAGKALVERMLCGEPTDERAQGAQPSAREVEEGRGYAQLGDDQPEPRPPGARRALFAPTPTSQVRSPGAFVQVEPWMVESEAAPRATKPKAGGGGAHVAIRDGAHEAVAQLPPELHESQDAEADALRRWAEAEGLASLPAQGEGDRGREDRSPSSSPRRPHDDPHGGEARRGERGVGERGGAAVEQQDDEAGSAEPPWLKDAEATLEDSLGIDLQEPNWLRDAAASLASSNAGSPQSHPSSRSPSSPRSPLSPRTPRTPPRPVETAQSRELSELRKWAEAEGLADEAERLASEHTQALAEAGLWRSPSAEDGMSSRRQRRAASSPLSPGGATRLTSSTYKPSSRYRSTPSVALRTRAHRRARMRLPTANSPLTLP